MENNPANMEQRILDAATEIFVDQGFAKTTTAQIAQKAGCNPALLHYYFRTKEKLFEQIFEQKSHIILGRLAEVDNSTGPFDQKIAKIVGAHFDFLKENTQLVPFLIGELLDNPTRFMNVYGHRRAEIFSRFAAELHDEVTRGTIKPISMLDIASTVMSLNIGTFLVLHVMRQLNVMPDEAIDQWLESRKQEIIETVLSRIKL
jgi:AcrR family transcriptional regulator